MRIIEEHPGDRRPPTRPLASVTAVVLMHNEVDDTEKCVKSLLEVDYPALHIIVVDNASKDGSPKRFRELFPSIPIIELAKNGGYAAGNNVGIRRALIEMTNYVLIANSDIVVERDFLRPMVEIAERRPEVGVVIPTIRYQSHPDQLYYAAGIISRMLCTGVNKGPDAVRASRDSRDLDVDFANGALILVKRSVFEELGLIDERFFLYFDDLEFSQRWGTKYRLVYTPRAVVYHKSGAGKGWRTYTEPYLYYNTRNRFWVFQDQPLWYRAYVAAFSIVNAIAKSGAILMNFFTEPARARRQFSALWRGIWDGFFGGRSS